MTAIVATVSSRPSTLPPDAIARYRRDGFHFPIGVLSEAEAREYRRQLETFEAIDGRPLAGALRHKSHLLFTWLSDLVRHPRILDAVEDIIGPNLLCWSSSFFISSSTLSSISASL